jgi:hypothetical protein
MSWGHSRLVTAAVWPWSASGLSMSPPCSCASRKPHYRPINSLSDNKHWQYFFPFFSPNKESRLQICFLRIIPSIQYKMHQRRLPDVCACGTTGKLRILSTECTRTPILDFRRKADASTLCRSVSTAETTMAPDSKPRAIRE